MSRVTLYRLTLPLLLGVAAPLAQAADPQALLMRMQQAASNLDYDGTFVFQRGDQLESLRIVHKASGGVTRERLVSLNGAPREILRTDSEVRCYLPDENAVLIEHRRADNRNFPALLPDTLSVLKKNYRVRTGASGRVAGRAVQLVTITPRDTYRYGYQLWADKPTGLLLRASLIDAQGQAIEQYMFTQISIGASIAESELAPQIVSKGVAAPRRVAEPEEAPAASSDRWEAAQLPAGYELKRRMRRRLSARQQPVEQLVYSDGLAVVSVFIEPVDSAVPSVLSGHTHMGAVHAFGKVTEGHQVTVLGEAPAVTVNMIGVSVAPQPR